MFKPQFHLFFLQTLAALPDQDSFYDMLDSLEEQDIETVSQRHLGRKGTDLDLVEQLNIYEVGDTKSHKITRKILQADTYLLIKIRFQLVSDTQCSHPVNMTPYSIYSTFALYKISPFVKHLSPLPLHTQSTFPPDDPAAWRRWRWQPASTNGTPGPPTSQPWGRG